MYTIIREGRWGKITPEPTNLENNRLKSGLSYVKKDARFMPNPSWGYVKLFKEKTNRFPIGLIQRVEKIIPCTYQDNKKVPSMVKYGDLRPYQRDALMKLMNNTNGIIKMPTGSGKTRLMVQYMKNYPMDSFLVLVPTLDLVTQWEEQVPPRVHVKTYAAIKKKSYVQQFDCVVFDECHHVAAKTLYKIGMNVRQDAKLYGLSATPLDRDDDNMKVEAVLGTIIYNISTRDLIDQGYLCDAKIYYHILKPKVYAGYKRYPDVYNEYIVYNNERNNEIHKITAQADKPCLILVSLIEHGESLKERLKYYDTVFLNGQTKKDDRKDNNHQIIIATSIYDEGVDLPALRTLILASGGKSSIKATQRIGRLLRPLEGKEYAVVHDFKDNCKYLDKHYKKRRKIFERDFEVIDVEE